MTTQIQKEAIVSPRPSAAGQDQSLASMPLAIMPDGRQRIPLGSGTITALLGQGGMANVYEIWNGQLEVARAVKLINPNCSRDGRERFQTEMKISAKLHHPNIVEIYGVGAWNGLPYMEMEKLDGVTLDVLIRERGAMPPAVCTAIGLMVGRALRYAHSQQYALYGKTYRGVIHRDLKPSNIMVCRNGTVKLMDFGIASPAEASFHTVMGTVLGTLQYLAPEQLKCQKVNVTSDLYALGATLYEVLTGEMAFGEPGVHKLMLDKLRGRYRPLGWYRLHTPWRLKRLVQRCMRQDPARRTQNGDHLLRELSRVHFTITTESPEQVMRRLLATAPLEKVVVATRPVWLIRLAAAMAFGTAAGIAVWFAVPRLTQPEPAVSVTGPSESNPPSAEHVRLAAPAGPPEPPPPRTAHQMPEVHVPVAENRLSAPSPAPSATVPSAPDTVQPAKTFIDTLREKHRTDDLLVMVRNEYRGGAYENALRVYDSLPEPQQRMTEALLYKLRTLQARGDSVALAHLLKTHSVDDGEFVLAKGIHAYETARYGDALELLERSKRLPRLLMPYEDLKQEVCYYKSLSATGIYDTNPTEENYRDALHEWWQLKSLLRTEPNHEYHERILSETQRMGRKHRQAKGS